MQSARNTSGLDDLRGKTIDRADSSLTLLVIRFDDGSGLLLEAVGDATDPEISWAVKPAHLLPEAKDAVCAVDWGWIAGAKIEQVSGSKGSVRFQLDPAGPLTVSALVWQGAPFLAFQPFKQPR
ncbi:MAG TPA: hypothetical protein V6D08_08960 [Candidatus Obscuribacterales bacterium]